VILLEILKEVPFRPPSESVSDRSLFAVFEPAIIERRERAFEDINNRAIDIGALNRV
jgi:hypothetical protein